MTTVSTYINRKVVHRNLFLFIAGKGISVFGSSIYTFAMSLYVLRLTGSALSFATNLFLGIIPMLIISPIAGVLVDRFSKKNLMILMDALNGLLFTLMFFISYTQELSLLSIYTATVLLTAFSTVFNISVDSGQPALVTKDYLLRLNAISRGIDSFSAIMGPILGGLVYAFFDIKLFIFINAISFFFSAFTEIFLDFSVTPECPKPKTKSSFKADILEGIQYFRHSGELKILTGTFIFINFFLGFSIQVPMPYMINEIFMIPPKLYGIINSFFPVGMILGSVTVEWFMKKYDYNHILKMMIWVMAACSILVGIPLTLPSQGSTVSLTIYYSLIMFIFGIAIAFIDIPIMYIFQKNVPDDIRGRILSLVTSGVKIILPLSLLLSGFLVQLLPVHVLPIAGGVMAILYGLILSSKRDFAPVKGA